MYVKLASRLEINAATKYKERAELLLEKAKDGNVTVSGIESLIGAGAEISRLNNIFGLTYLHEVNYKGKRFACITEKPIFYIIDNDLKG